MARLLSAVFLAILVSGACVAISSAEPPKADAAKPARKAETPATPQTQVGGADDARQAIELSAPERARMLEGMRLYLQAIQGIVDALAKNQLDGAAQFAHEAGAKMLQDAPMSIPLKAPLEFTALSLQTHEKFDVLADRARSASRGDVLTALAEIMNNCTGCHSAYRVVTKP